MGKTRMKIDKVLLDVIYEHTVLHKERGEQRGPGGDECEDVGSTALLFGCGCGGSLDDGALSAGH